MFISKAEKDRLIASVSMLQEQVRGLTAQVMLMMRHPEVRKEKPKRQMSSENRAKLSAMMKKRHADAKAQKEKA